LDKCHNFIPIFDPELEKNLQTIPHLEQLKNKPVLVLLILVGNADSDDESTVCFLTFSFSTHFFDNNFGTLKFNEKVVYY